VAISLVLLTGIAISAQLLETQSQPLGFQTEHVVTASSLYSNRGIVRTGRDQPSSTNWKPG
jgi:hypothetical protein